MAYSPNRSGTELCLTGMDDVLPHAPHHHNLSWWISYVRLVEMEPISRWLILLHSYNRRITILV